jgi:hypothetical protein
MRKIPSAFLDDAYDASVIYYKRGMLHWVNKLQLGN